MNNGAVIRQNRGDSTIGARIDLGDETLNEHVLRGMENVEDRLRVELEKSPDFLQEKVMHLTKAGGKRFRPMFTLLASNYGPRPMCEDVFKAAVVVEMTHLATLYHDDVMDEAQMRRGVPSANMRWSNSVAILSGDILLAHASRIMSELGVDTVAHFAETFGALVTGQMRETEGPGTGDPIEHYMKVINEKTGVLIAAAGYLGALHSGADMETAVCLQAVGAAVGMVFQIVDDIIDIFSTPEDSGKTPGTDLREGGGGIAGTAHRSACRRRQRGSGTATPGPFQWAAKSACRRPPVPGRSGGKIRPTPRQSHHPGLTPVSSGYGGPCGIGARRSYRHQPGDLCFYHYR